MENEIIKKFREFLVKAIEQFILSELKALKEEIIFNTKDIEKSFKKRGV